MVIDYYYYWCLHIKVYVPFLIMDDLQFIEELRIRPVIWNYKLPNHYRDLSKFLCRMGEIFDLPGLFFFLNNIIIILEILAICTPKFAIG